MGGEWAAPGSSIPLAPASPPSPPAPSHGLPTILWPHVMGILWRLPGPAPASLLAWDGTIQSSNRPHSKQPTGPASLWVQPLDAPPPIPPVNIPRGSQGSGSIFMDSPADSPFQGSKTTTVRPDPCQPTLAAGTTRAGHNSQRGWAVHAQDQRTSLYRKQCLFWETWLRQAPEPRQLLYINTS